MNYRIVTGALVAIISTTVTASADHNFHYPKFDSPFKPMIATVADQQSMASYQADLKAYLYTIDQNIETLRSLRQSAIHSYNQDVKDFNRTHATAISYYPTNNPASHRGSKVHEVYVGPNGSNEPMPFSHTIEKSHTSGSIHSESTTATDGHVSTHSQTTVTPTENGFHRETQTTTKSTSTSHTTGSSKGKSKSSRLSVDVPQLLGSLFQPKENNRKEEDDLNKKLDQFLKSYNQAKQ